MNSESAISIISTTLQEWYSTHRRDLPWRTNSDPYRIWLSEIILQQTRVEQGLPYFERITHRFPDVHTLANAPIDELLKLWQGLGYYSRARNLYAAAQQVVRDFGGRFPDSYDTLLQLKGVGEYTAAAIASIAYGEAKAVVDGNVFRVISRLYALDTPTYTTEGKKQFTTLAQQLLDPSHPSEHNQALMDFGAMQCTPASPRCSDCPLQAHCLAYASDTVSQYPVRRSATPKRERFFHYLMIVNGNNTYIQQREHKDIWQHLWEFPLLEADHEMSTEEWLQDPLLAPFAQQTLRMETPVKLRHILSHQIIHALFVTLHVSGTVELPPESSWRTLSLSDLSGVAVSRLTEKFLVKSEHN
jgi:A/G-specific adenine glycosylase